VRFIVKPLLLLSFLGGLSLACSLSAIGLASPNVSPTGGIFLTATSVVLPSPLQTPAPVEILISTPLPGVRIASGDRQLLNGDWDTALQEFQNALNTAPDNETRAAALLGLGHIYYLTGNYPEALRALRSVIDDFPDSPERPNAFFFLAQTYTLLQRYAEASEAYQNYLDLRPGVIDSYVREMHGDLLTVVGDSAGAAGDYQAALQDPRSGDLIGLKIKLSQAYAGSGDYATALVMYQDIFNQAQEDYTKAQMRLRTGQAYMALGQTDQAYAAYLDAVENYPTAYDSYTALVELVNADYPVNDIDRGIVDYYAGKYGLAFAAFDHFMQSVDPASPQADINAIGTARYYRGLALRARGENQAAIDEWNIIIQNYPQYDRWVDAWEQKGYTLWAFMDDYAQSVETFLEFVKTAPQHSLAAQFLSDAARVAERDGNLARAAEIWERVPQEYPISEHAYRSIFLAAICRYRLGEYSSANADMQRALSLTTDVRDRAAALLWMGKGHQAVGNMVEARTALEQAIAADPTGYYSERARELLIGNAPFTPPLAYDLGFDVQAERLGAELWLKSTFGLPEDTVLSEPGPLYDDARLQRGAELWNLGLYNEANDEFTAMRLEYQNDPANLYRLANYLFDLGDYRTAIQAIRQVLTLNGMDDAATLSAPALFNRLRFGAYYKDILTPLAQQYGFHPLFLFSVVRQESLFEGFAYSQAGARGLMQIIPTTGQSLADKLGWPPNYTADDLYRPKVSAVFGVDYLASQRDLFNGDLYAALAAYNGGPGNASVWKSLAPNDPDLLLEVIRFEESRKYIMGIYEIFSIYQQLYNRTP